MDELDALFSQLENAQAQKATSRLSEVRLMRGTRKRASWPTVRPNCCCTARAPRRRCAMLGQAKGPQHSPRNRRHVPRAAPQARLLTTESATDTVTAAALSLALPSRRLLSAAGAHIRLATQHPTVACTSLLAQRSGPCAEAARAGPAGRRGDPHGHRPRVPYQGAPQGAGAWHVGRPVEKERNAVERHTRTCYSAVCLLGGAPREN